MSGGGQSIPNLKVKGCSGMQVYEDWRSFLFQFRNFLLEFGHKTADEKKKVALLMHLLGPNVIQIFSSFNVTIQDVKLEDLVKKIEGYFSPKKKISLERYTFFSRKQKIGFLIKDMFIIGLKEEHNHIRERLLQEEYSKYLEVIDIARTIEMSRTKEEHASNNVLKVNYKNFKKSHKTTDSYQKKSKCERCGYRQTLSRNECKM